MWGRGGPRVVSGSVNAGVCRRLGLARHLVAARVPGVTPRSRGSPRASLGPSRCDFDPFVVLTSRRDNGNEAQGRGASPRTLGKRVRVCAHRSSRRSMRQTRVFRDRNTRRAASSACRVGTRRAAGCFGLGERRCVALSWARPTSCRRACTRGYAAKRGSPRASLGSSRCDSDPRAVLPSPKFLHLEVRNVQLFE